MDFLVRLVRRYVLKRCCRQIPGHFGDSWYCLLPHGHEPEHIFAPDLWPGGKYGDTWMKLGGIKERRGR